MDAVLNWSGSYRFQASAFQRPDSIEEVQQIVRSARRVHALGTRHSFNSIADTPGTLISLKKLDRVLEVDARAGTVTVEGGVTYGRLCDELCRQGFALPNLASLPHISVAGACATATHGSGDRNLNLASAVRALQIVRADGELVRIERGDLDFEGAPVHLGALGVVVALTLDILPSFEVTQTVYERIPWQSVLTGFEEVMASGYSVSLFTDWTGPMVNHVWVKDLAPSVAKAPAFEGWSPAESHVHPISGMAAENCTLQMGIVGSWQDRLPHFRMDFMPSSGEELQAEYLIPREYAVDALAAVRELGTEIAPHLHISEVRSIAADDLWMSPFFERTCIAVHFTWKQHGDAVEALLPRIEAKLEPFEARPHWGKLFAMSPDCVRRQFPRRREFVRLARSFDPEGKFENEFLRRYVFGEAHA